MFKNNLRWFFVVLSIMLISVSCASIKDINTEKSILDKQPYNNDQLKQESKSTGINSGNIPQPLISRGYENEEDYPVHYATYTTSGGGYNPLTVVALAVFGVLGLLLFLQLLGVQSFRSAGSSWLHLPGEWNIRAEDIPDMMAKVTNWIDTLPGGTEGVLKRTVRDVTGSNNFDLTDWILAYKKDPIEYQYIRKLACKTLGTSQLVQRSVESQMGKTIMSALGYLIEDGTELAATVRDIIGHPEKCIYITFGSEEDYENSTLEKNSLN